MKKKEIIIIVAVFLLFNVALLMWKGSSKKDTKTSLNQTSTITLQNGII